MTTATVVVDPAFEASAAVPALIVGGGACGLTASLQLAHSGIETLVVERDTAPMGSTSLSSGFIPAAGTRCQAALGIADSPSQLVADIQAKAHGLACPQLAEAYAHTIGEVIDWLQETHGFEWEVLTDFLYPGHHVHRMHTLPQRQGAALVQALASAAERSGVTVYTSAHVHQLVVNEQSQIRGVRLTRPDGAIESIGCEALILACNGYGGSIELRTRFIPEMLHATFAGHTGNDGSAVLWGEALGANLADMSAYQGHGSWAMPHGSLVTWALMIQGGIQVNSRGERFHDESQGYSEAAVQVVAQPHQAAWCVYDDPIHTLGMTFPDYIDAQSLGAVKVCDDLSTLAAVIGCPESALTQTLAQTARTEHDQFGRQFARPLRAPFYAIKVTGAIFHTQGGLDVDADCRVKRVDGSRLANLWAAGGAARGVSGPHVSGYLSGNGLLSAVAGGAIAAKSVTTYLKGL